VFLLYEDFLALRIAKLRISKGVSARDMSLSIGQADNYINHIENKKSLPSITAFFYICEYLKITPQEFFEEENKNPKKLNSIIKDLKKLDSESFDYIAGVIKAILRKQ